MGHLFPAQMSAKAMMVAQINVTISETNIPHPKIFTALKINLRFI